MSRFIPTDRKTAYLLPPSMEDWLNEDHLACFVVEVIDQLDLSALTRKYAGRGVDAGLSRVERQAHGRIASKFRPSRIKWLD